MRPAEHKTSHVINRLCTFALILLCTGVLCFCGCAVLDAVELFNPEGPPDYAQIAQSYTQTQLKFSTSADALVNIGSGSDGLSENELLSQSTSVVGLVGQKKKGYKTWLKMVAFEENEMTAQRKYLFIVDEKPKALFVTPWAYVIFNCEMVLETDVLDVPYASENAKRIAILKKVKENANSDVKQLELDNKMIAVSGSVINQALETVLTLLENSPALAARLDTTDGLKFEHISLDKGQIKMNLFEDIVTIEMKLGSIIKKRLALPAGKIDEPPPQEEETTQTY